MNRTFKHLTYDLRSKIKEMLDNGYSKTEIAQELDLHRSTIYREIERGSVNGQYNPNYSEELYRQQLLAMGRKPILSIEPELAEYISTLILKDRLSPEQIVDLLKSEDKFSSFPQSVNTIYRAIDDGLIPNVTRDSLKSDTTIVFNDGQIHIAKWVRNLMNIKDGDKLHFEIVDNKLIFTKNIE